MYKLSRKKADTYARVFRTPWGELISLIVPTPGTVTIPRTAMARREGHLGRKTVCTHIGGRASLPLWRPELLLEIIHHLRSTTLETCHPQKRDFTIVWLSCIKVWVKRKVRMKIWKNMSGIFLLDRNLKTMEYSGTSYNKKSKCSNDSYSPFYMVSLQLSSLQNQPLQIYGLLHITLQQNDCTSSSFLIILRP